MTKITALILLVGLTLNVGAEEGNKTLKDVFKADWLIGSWARENGSTVTYGWKIKDVLMYKESKSSKGQVYSFSLISLDEDKKTVHYHSFHNDGYVSIGELSSIGKRVLRTAKWTQKKLTLKEIASRVENYVANKVAAGEVDNDGIAALKKERTQFLKVRKTSGTNAIIWELKGSDTMASTSVFKNESGNYVEGDDSWSEISTRVK